MLHIAQQLSTTPTDKSALLFIHGAWLGAWCWEEFYLPYFAEQGFDAYALDLRGHGQSPNSKSLRFTSLGDYVDDVAEAVAQINRPVVVIGHSMGGMIVQRYLKTNHRALGGVLLSTVPWYGALKDSVYFLQHMPIKFLKMMFSLSVFPLVEDQTKAAKFLLATDATAKEIEKYTAPLQDESYLAFMQLALPSFGKISSPLLVVSGAADRLLNPKSQQSTAKRYNADCHIVKDAPHDIIVDKRWRDSAIIIQNWVSETFK